MISLLFLHTPTVTVCLALGKELVPYIVPEQMESAPHCICTDNTYTETPDNTLECTIIIISTEIYIYNRNVS